MTQFFPLAHVLPNPFQPRQTMDEEGITELAANILASRQVAPATHGLLQIPRGRQRITGVQLAYGHRRLAAFWHLYKQGHQDYAQFPVELDELTDADMAVAAWVENSARVDINPMEEAHYIRRLMDEFGWTIQQAADRLGVSRSVSSNIIRLVNLPEAVQKLVASRQLARARAIELCGLQGRISDAELIDLAHSGTGDNHRAWHHHLNGAHRNMESKADLRTTVIEPAAQTLASALQADDPGAWLVIARAIDAKAADIDSAAALANMVIERATLRAESAYAGRRRVNDMFGAAGIEPPWNVAATAKVTEFVAWRKKHQKRARSA